MRKLASLMLLSLCVHTASFADYSPIERVSVKSSEAQADGASTAGSVSASTDGRYVVFESDAADLISSDTNEQVDIFFRDRTAGTTSRVSISNAEAEANGPSANAHVSSNGRYVVFESFATNLVSSDTNESSDIFVRDRTAGTTTRISVTSAEIAGNGDSRNPRISSDGRYIVFESDADNLVANDDNGDTDIFLRDTVAGTTERISLHSDGSEANAASANPDVSDDGAYVVFDSLATNLVAADTNAVKDVFLHTVGSGVTARVSVNTTTSIQGNAESSSPLISADGAFIVFNSAATNLVSADTNAKQDVFLYDRVGVALSRVSVKSNGQQADDDSTVGALNSTGRYIAFSSDAANLVSSDTNAQQDIFVHDRVSADTVRVSVRSSGAQSKQASIAPALNSNANFLAFASLDSRMVSSDTNSNLDVFVINLQCLVQPAGVVALDTDGDGPDDCTEECATDPAKTTAGACGCGVADTDTDGDTAADCIDQCASDPLKTERGSCGCGESDADANANGVSDCLDPSTQTKPRKPRVERLNSNRIRAVIPQDFAAVTYQVQLFRNSTLIRTKSGQDRKSTLRGSGSGLYVRYRIELPGGGFSRFSRKVEVS